MSGWVWAGLLGAVLWTLPVQAREVWRMSTAELPPAIGAKLPSQGYYPVLVRRVLQELDTDLELDFLPPHRAMQEAAEGRHIAVFPMVRTPEREREFLVSEPIFIVRVRVFVRRDDPWNGGGVEALRGHLLCNILGAKLHPELQQAVDDGRLQVQRVGEIGACFRMLALRRVRFVVTGENTGFEGMQALPDGGRLFRVAGPVLAEQPVHLLFSRRIRGNAQRMQAFDQALRRLRSQGVMAKLEQQVLPQAPKPTATR